MGILVSFCITVFNQIQMVKNCINSILAYEGQDIEIVISDDRSTENIQELVSSFHDDRIRYYLNDENLGHDRNIVNALSKATGKYAFLLRTRDLIIPDKIPLLLAAARNDNASYITGEAINEKGDLKIYYTKECFMKGKEAIEANYKLYIHPSGCMYRLTDLNPNQYREFLDKHNVPKNGFIVHNMIRIVMATKGDFRLIKEPVWVYTDTEMATDRAVNKSNNGLSVYDPSIVEKRYEYEAKWAMETLNDDEYRIAYYHLTALYLDLLTWGFKLTNNDKQSQHHYDYEKVPFSVIRERNRFKKISEEIYNQRPMDSQDVYKKEIQRLFFKNRTSDAVKYVARTMTYKTPLYNTVARMYKKYSKGL